MKPPPVGFVGNKQITWVHTLVIGSGAAGLNAALQLRMAGVRDILIVTEGLNKGTSINTGSDKQTYYKLSQYGADDDSVYRMAGTYFAGGSMHGDLALAEAANSSRAFYNLVNIGVPFPHDRFGQFIGYKTDHDPRQRATSIGPYTSQEMCRALIKQIRLYDIPVEEGLVVIKLITTGEEERKRIAGAIAVDQSGSYRLFGAENVILAVGGPGGLYAHSVYPEVHTGGIGLALLEGAEAQNLPESQYGLASTKFRWNVSGSFMQVIPRFLSYEQDGKTGVAEFLKDYFERSSDYHNLTFLKGYQWPFDSRKLQGGSSLIDILVYQETVLRNRRVFLDFKENPSGFHIDALAEEASEYLRKSNAIGGTPVERLISMNPSAYNLYLKNGIDLAKDPLEIAVCAQHNNGGLAGNIWWESTNIRHLFPVGEVNGSHGVYRPGGAALNAGQVGSLRAALFIANRYQGWSLDQQRAKEAFEQVIETESEWLSRCQASDRSWREERFLFQKRMSAFGAHIRSGEGISEAIDEARQQWEQIQANGCSYSTREETAAVFPTRYLCFSHLVYLEAIRFNLLSGVGSRGSMIALDKDGMPVHPQLSAMWKYREENTSFRGKVLMTEISAALEISNKWVNRRLIPVSDGWFETSWADYRHGTIFD